MKESVIYQAQKKSCAYACVKMALVHASKNRAFREIREPSCNGKTPSLQDAQDFAKENGLILTAWRIVPEDLAFADTFPLLCVVSRNGLSHMVYVQKKRKEKFLVFDPGLGEIWMKEEELIKMFTGVYLEISSYEEIRNPKHVRIMPAFGTVLQIASSLLAVFLFAAGSLVLDSSYPLLAPLMLLGAVVSVVVYVIASLLSMKVFDSTYQKQMITTDISQRRRLFNVYYRYRTDAVSGTSMRVMSFAVPLAFGALLSFQDPLLGITLVMDLLLLVVSWATDVPVADRAKSRLESQENSFQYSALTEEAVADRLDELNKSSRSLTRYLCIRQVMVFVVAIGFALLSLFIQDGLSFGKAALYSVSSVFFMLQVDKCYLNLREKHPRMKREMAFRQAFVDSNDITRTHEGKNGLE